MHPHTDEEKIFQITTDFQAAWNKADEKAMVGYFVDDCLRVGAFGEVQKGKVEIAAAYIQLLKKELPGSKVLHEKGMIRFITPDVATWQAPSEIFSSGARSLKGYTNAIFKKQNDEWLISEIHARIYPL
jgi:uncharacterized protein (TIGR02246 family)